MLYVFYDAKCFFFIKPAYHIGAFNSEFCYLLRDQGIQINYTYFGYRLFNMIRSFEIRFIIHFIVSIESLWQFGYSTDKKRGVNMQGLKSNIYRFCNHFQLRKRIFIRSFIIPVFAI